MVLPLFLVKSWFGLGLAKILVVWLSLIFPASVHVFTPPSCHNRPKTWTKTMDLAIFLVLAWFGLVLILVSVQILNALAKPVQTIPQTPQTDFRHLRYG